MSFSRSLFVPGIPQPKGSTRGFVRGGRVIITTANPKNKKFSNLVVLAAAPLAPLEPITGAVAVGLQFSFPRPKSAPKRVVHHVTKPDIDKLARCVLDALTEAGWWRGDQQVVTLTCTKAYGHPGVDISVLEINNG